MTGPPPPRHGVRLSQAAFIFFFFFFSFEFPPFTLSSFFFLPHFQV